MAIVGFDGAYFIIWVFPLSKLLRENYKNIFQHFSNGVETQKVTQLVLCMCAYAQTVCEHFLFNDWEELRMSLMFKNL